MLFILKKLLQGFYVSAKVVKHTRLDQNICKIMRISQVYLNVWFVLYTMLFIYE